MHQPTGNPLATYGPRQQPSTLTGYPPPVPERMSSWYSAGGGGDAPPPPLGMTRVVPPASSVLRSPLKSQMLSASTWDLGGRAANLAGPLPPTPTPPTTGPP